MRISDWSSDVCSSDLEFVGEQWPALGKIDAAAEVQALEALKPDGIYNVTFGGDLARFVREGNLRELFKDRTMLGLLTGEPEYLDPLGEEAPEGDRKSTRLNSSH